MQNKKGIKIKYQIKKEIEDLVLEVQFAIRQEELANEEKKVLRSLLKQLISRRDKL